MKTAPNFTRSRLFQTLRVVLVALALTSISNCGDGGKGSQVTLKLSPKSPTVFPFDAQVPTPDGSGGYTYQSVPGPYFAFTFQVENKSDAQLTIVALTMTAIDATGKEAGEVYDGADLLVPLPYLMQINAGQTEGFGTEIFVMGNLPEQGNNFRYRLRARLVGYFGDQFGESGERFDRNYFFTTQ